MTQVARDYASEMRAVIDAETGHGPYVSRIVAEAIVEKLHATDPELLDGWLHAQAAQMVWQTINDRDRSRRASARATAGRSLFAAAAGQHAAGDSSALTQFLGMPFTVDGVRKRLADLTGADLTQAAVDYQRRADQNTMTAAFLRALGKKVKRGTVSDHFTEQQLATLWTSIVRN